MKEYPPMAPVDEDRLDANTSYARILRFVDGPARVVDLGCGPGDLAKLLTARGCRVTGVDVSSKQLEHARANCREVVQADLETVRLENALSGGRFDIAICADILEHLRDPGRLLEEIRSVLAPDGYLIASIPNIAHGAVRLALLRGEFDYQEFGLLDDTHIRFFTHKTAIALLERAGFAVEALDRTLAPIFDPESELVPKLDRAAFPSDLIAAVEADPESETLQFVIKAAPNAAAIVRPRDPGPGEGAQVQSDVHLDVLARLYNARQEAEAAERRLAALSHAIGVTLGSAAEENPERRALP